MLFSLKMAGSPALIPGSISHEPQLAQTFRNSGDSGNHPDLGDHRSEPVALAFADPHPDPDHRLYFPRDNMDCAAKAIATMDGDGVTPLAPSLREWRE